MRKLLLIVVAAAVLPGCQLFPRWVSVPAYYPIIKKPVLHGKILVPNEKDEKDVEQERDIWEGNCIILHEYVESLGAAVDAYNLEAEKRNAAVSVLQEK